MSTKRVVIVGGGFAGLSAAYTLKRRGVTPLLLEAQDHVGGRGSGETVDGFSLDMGAFVFTSTYDTAFRLCEELDLPLVPSKMKFGHHRNGRWVTTTPDQSFWNFIRHMRTAITMGFLSPAGLRAGFKVMRQIHRESAYMTFASDSPIAEIDNDEIKRRMLTVARRNAPPGSTLPADDEGLFYRVCCQPPSQRHPIPPTSLSCPIFQQTSTKRCTSLNGPFAPCC